MDVEDLRFPVLLRVRMVWDVALCRWVFPDFSKERVLDPIKESYQMLTGCIVS